MEIIILLGPPGAGKGTQAQLLAQKTDYNIISSSKLIRKKFKQDSQRPAVKKAKKQYKSGELVDPEIFAQWTIELLEQLKPQSGTGGVIFDGFLRTLTETKKVLPYLKRNFQKEKIKIFYLNVSKQEIKKRLSERLICNDCKTPLPPSSDLKQGDKCPTEGCEGEIVKRKLDNPEIVQERIRAFQRQTVPSLNYIRKQGLLTEIDGDTAVETIHQQIVAHLKNNG